MSPEEITRLYQRIIAIEARITELEQKKVTMPQDNKQVLLEERIKVLEEARKVQIGLNAKFEAKQSITPKVSFFDFFKK